MTHKEMLEKRQHAVFHKALRDAGLKKGVLFTVAQMRKLKKRNVQKFLEITALHPHWHCRVMKGSLTDPQECEHAKAGFKSILANMSDDAKADMLHEAIVVDDSIQGKYTNVDGTLCRPRTFVAYIETWVPAELYEAQKRNSKHGGHQQWKNEKSQDLC